MTSLKVRGTLLSRLTNIVVITDAGGTETLTIQNYAESDDLEFWGSSFDEAIDGSLRSNFRDFRRKISLSYNLCVEPEQFHSICNNISTDLNNGAEFVYIGIDTENVIRVVLDDDFASRVQYANQHGLFIPKINLVAYDIGLQIELNFEDWRFVYESVTEQRDYRYIYEAATTLIDYGSI